MGGSVGMGGWKSKKRREISCSGLPIVKLAPSVASGNSLICGRAQPQNQTPPATDPGCAHRLAGNDVVASRRSQAGWAAAELLGRSAL